MLKAKALLVYQSGALVLHCDGNAISRLLEFRGQGVERCCDGHFLC